MEVSPLREQLIEGNKTFHDITEEICKPVLGKPTKAWWAIFLVAASALGLGVVCAPLVGPLILPTLCFGSVLAMQVRSFRPSYCSFVKNGEPRSIDPLRP